VGVRNSILIFGDQLNDEGAALKDADPARDVVVMVEAIAKARERPYHKRKLALLYSAMRHFAAGLRERGFVVDYVVLDGQASPATFDEAMAVHVALHQPERVVVMEPNEYGIREAARGWQETLGVPVEMRADNLFMATHEDFEGYTARRRIVRMEDFYHDLRRRYNVLMEGAKPVGGAFNFDKDNRQRYTADAARPLPAPPAYLPDETTQTVLALIEKEFPDHFGSLDGFDLPVTRAQALHLLGRFLDEALPHFGDYEDAMVQGEWLLYHSLISHVQNIGLVTAEEVVRAAEARYYDGTVPINSAEGFIRQILGWREYMRGMYWHLMPGFHDMNYFGHTRHLPRFYWTGDTRMNCVSTAVKGLQERGYSHHIQRLMVLANWANLAGVIPREINDWFWETYIDAYDWVVTPNVVGMALYADGGLTASKPYLGGGNYINSMSDYCAHCTYKVKEKTGPEACPFNYLYWNFLDAHKAQLEDNRRIVLPLKTLSAKGPQEMAAIRASSRAFLAQIDEREGGSGPYHQEQNPAT